jgi:hypothetical protein
MSSLEPLAIFLCICGQNRSNTSVQNTSKHSGETISRKNDDVLRCLIKMAKDYIRLEDRNFTIVHKMIKCDRRMWPHFKGCIGAIDGIHIGAIPTPRDNVRYIGRFGTPTQNVMVWLILIYASHMHLLDSQTPCMTQVCYSMPLNMILVPSHILLMVYISFDSICCIQSHLCSYICLYLSI